MKRSFAFLTAVVLFSSLGPVQAAPKSAKAPVPPPEPEHIVLRHGLSGAPLDMLATLVLRFNDEEAKLKTASGRIQLEDVQGVADKGHLPHLALFDEEDALAMFGTRPRFRPLHQVMAAGKQNFDARHFYPQIFDAVDDIAGKMQALPLALSVPVLFYNKAAFAKAGLDPEVPPKTWWEVQDYAGKLRDSGSKCPLTSSRFAWVHVENVASQHNEPLVVKNGKQEQLALNNMVNVKHMALLTSWHKSLYFIYSGPGEEGNERFAKGECGMLTAESALLSRLKQPGLPFQLGVAVLPHYDDVYGVQAAKVLPDGGSLWVLAADKKPEQEVIARFIAFLMRPDVQREWVRATGFLPMSPAAVQALREAGVNPAVLAQAEQRLSMPKRDAARTKIGHGRSKIRNILNEEVEFVWGNQKPPKAALDAAVMRAAPVLADPSKP